MRKYVLALSILPVVFWACGKETQVFLEPHPPTKAWSAVEKEPVKALNLPEDSVYDVEAKGFAYLRLGRLDEAEAKFKEALDMGEEEFSNLGLGLVYEKRGDFLYAYLYYLKSIHPEAKSRLETIRDKALSQALASASPDEISKALIIDPNFREAYVRLAEIYISRGDYFLAAAYLKKGMAVSGEDEKLLKLYARVLELDGKLKDALNVLKRVYRLYPTNENRAAMDRLQEEIERLEIEEKLKPVRGKVIISRGDLALIIDAYFGKYFKGEKPPIITDIYRGEEMEAILRVTAEGLMKVFPDHTFQPDMTVNRLNFSRVLYKLLKKMNARIERMNFPVLVDTNSFEARAIVGFGIMEAPGGAFKPYEPVKLQEALFSMEKLRKLLRRMRFE